MKEKYFSDDNIDLESHEMIEEVKYYSGMRLFKPDVDHMGLVVVDMQNYFLDPEQHAFIPSGPVIKDNIIKIMKACHNRGIPVFITRHINTKDDAAMMGIRWHEIILKEDPRSEIDKDILEAGGTELIKSQFDAFYKTDLEERLRNAGVKQIILVGVMTNVCCETTARVAFIKGFDVVMPVDATAAYNYEFHLATFLNMSYLFSRPIITNTLLDHLKNA